MKNYRHLSWNDRLTIERMLLKKYPKKAIADAIGCSLGTIYNELARAKYIHTNSDLTNEERYSPDLAEQRYRQMLKKKGKKPFYKEVAKKGAKHGKGRRKGSRAK